MWDSIKAFFANVWNNIVNAVQALADEQISVDEFGNTIVTSSPAAKMAAKFSAVIIIAAGLFFTLYPFTSEGAVSLGGQLIRLATIMWNGSA
jgi:hypothetical protein